jgi:type I restriction enzyme S subunit
MSFPKYPAYKDSGVEWLGEVPAHWMASPVKHFGRLKGGAGFPHEEQGIEGEEFDFHKVNALGQATALGILCPSENTISAETAKKLGAFVFPENTIVFAKVGAALLLSRLCLLPKPACLDNNMMGLVVNNDNNILYVRYAMNLVRFDLIANPGAVPSLNEGQIGNFILIRPPQEEQASIATFLTRETAKIDTLVAEQEKLIALLKEKRQAVISHSVTKGLDPSVPMKDSGVEWLGDVPAHWGVRRVKDVARLESGHTPSKQIPEYWKNCDIPWVSLNDSKYLAANDYITDTAFQINELGLANSSARLLPAGAVVFTRDATIGLAAITTRSMAVSQHLIAWCPSDQIDALYLLRVFNAMKEHLDSFTFGATIKTIGMGDVKQLVTPVPPVSEQRAISAYISKTCGALDKLIEEAKSAIALLQERRTALISAAVTGQIDVRHLA